MARLPRIEDRTFTAAYLRALADRPDAVAQIDAEREWTFAESFERSSSVAGGLRGIGVTRDSPVAVMLNNTLDAVHAWSAISLGGMIEVPINTTYKGEFLTHILNNSDAETIVVEDRYVDRLVAMSNTLHSLRTIVIRGEPHSTSVDSLRSRFNVVPFEELASAEAVDPARVDPSDLIAYMYTSGTTGPSKGVLTSHAQAYTYASREDQERPHHEDRMLVTTPLFHLAGQWYGVYQALIHQIPCVVAPSFTAKHFWRWVRDYEITYTTMLGTIAEQLYQQPETDVDLDNPLEFTIMAPLVSDVAEFRERFGVEIAAAYGSTEVGLVMNAAPETIVGGECGVARDEFDLKLVDPEGNEVERGEIGELLVRGQLPNLVMRGYHDMPGESAQVIRDGWIHTGDGFRQDSEGRFFFSDRMRDALRRRGLNISSYELERVINDFPGVHECAVVAVPSELAEDEIKAVVVMQPGMHASPAQLTWFLIDRLPRTMVPRYVEFVEALPKTPTHKIMKEVLRVRPLGPKVWDREAAGIGVN